MREAEPLAAAVRLLERVHARYSNLGLNPTTPERELCAEIEAFFAWLPEVSAPVKPHSSDPFGKPSPR